MGKALLPFPLLIPRVGADSGVLRRAPDPIFTRLRWPFASFSLCQGPSVLGLGVEKLLAGGGGLLTVPGLSVTRREESQGTHSPRKTHKYKSTHTHPLRAALRPSPQGPKEGNTSSCQGTQHPMINKQGHSKPQGHLLPFAPFRDTCKHLCREREAHTSKGVHTPLPLLYPCTKLTRDGTCAPQLPQPYPPELALSPPHHIWGEQAGDT